MHISRQASAKKGNFPEYKRLEDEKSDEQLTALRKLEYLIQCTIYVTQILDAAALNYEAQRYDESTAKLTSMHTSLRRVYPMEVNRHQVLINESIGHLVQYFSVVLIPAFASSSSFALHTTESRKRVLQYAKVIGDRIETLFYLLEAP